MSSKIIPKTTTEIELMRKSGKILADVLEHLIQIAKPGVTTLELDQIAEKLITDAGATPTFKGYRGYQFTLCTSVNDEIVHTFPSNYTLKDNDVLTIDCGVCYQGYNTDSASTIVIGKGTPKHINFVEEIRGILYGAIKLVKPGVRIGDISNYIETETNKYGYFVFRDLIGHGIGKQLHEPPEVPNYGKAGSGPVLIPGVTFCIEPIIGISTRIMEVMPDGWCIKSKDGGIACQQEHTILVTDTGYEILTLRSDETVY